LGKAYIAALDVNSLRNIFLGFPFFAALTGSGVFFGQKSFQFVAAPAEIDPRPLGPDLIDGGGGQA
jgi:hypothetical protein